MSGEDDGELKRKYMRWSGELQKAYLDALEQCGGLKHARPKALLDILSPRFPFLTLQNVKNHLQKQRTKEAKGGSGPSPGPSGRAAASSGGGESEDMDDMPMASEEVVAGAEAAAGGGISSRRQVESPTVTANAVPGAAAGAAAAAAGGQAAGGAPGPRGGGNIWMPDGWAVPLGDGSGVQPNSLIDLARRALALTVHQLGLYRKLLEELELHERDHTMLVSALREDPTGQSIVLDAQRAFSSGYAAGAAAPGQSTGTAGGSGSSSAAEETRPLRLRRLLARLLPPNPFSSGPKAEAALKLAAWIAAVTKEQAAEGASFSAASHLGAADGMPAGMMPMRATRAVSAPAGVVAGVGAAASLLGGLSGAASGGQQPATTTGAARPAAGSDDEDDAMQLDREPHRQRRKRHKPLSELLAEIPLQEPLPADRLAMQHAVPSASELQQLLGGPAHPGAAGMPGGMFGAVGGAAGAAGGPANDPLGGALSLLLQQHLQQAAAGGEGQPAGGGLQGQQGQQGQQEGMELDDDALMLRALDAQMSSLLLQSVSNALMRSAQDGDAPMGGTSAAQPPLSAGFDHIPAPGTFEAAAAAAAAGEIPVPSAFQAAAAGLTDGPLPTGALDISVLRSFLDMLSSGGLSPLASGALPHLPGEAQLNAAAAAPGAMPQPPLLQPQQPQQLQAQHQAQQQQLQAQHQQQQQELAARMNTAQAAAAAGQPLSVGTVGMNTSGGSGSSGGSGGRMGGAFSAFQRTASGGGAGM